ncbi:MULTISPECIES: hypothetical protein [Variovorax]|uniref:hypothetical protein n=1 Tax=Variovorax TaxID=34072 RepID=UPI002854A4ED|nr:hypothetical protein [Variovorax sp. 3319]MDR6888056.1 hypothetical protein [Variovorax sp. 3319]
MVIEVLLEEKMVSGPFAQAGASALFVATRMPAALRACRLPQVVAFLLSFMLFNALDVLP